MKTKRNVKEDPVVQEVRAARARLWQEGGESITGLSSLVKQRAKAIQKNRRKRKNQSTA